MEPAATHAPAPPARGTRHLRGGIAALAVALLLLLVAPFVMSAVFAIGTAVAVLAALVTLVLRRDRFRRRLRVAGVWLGFLLVTWGLIGLNFHLAEDRMQVLVDAVHAYQAATGAYPDDLTALIPAYVDRVPRATLWPTMNRFGWNARRALLTCVPVPPLGWIGYDFRSESRTGLD